MKTFTPKPADLTHDWYVIDATDVVLGRLATQAAILLRGKNKPTFTPHVDCGNFVIIVNAEKAVLTGNKMTDKYYYHHSGYIGGMKKVQYKTLMATKPERAMELAVKGMLPDTVIGRKAFTRLKVYAGATHNHEAQKPQVYDL